MVSQFAAVAVVAQPFVAGYVDVGRRPLVGGVGDAVAAVAAGDAVDGEDTCSSQTESAQQMVPQRHWDGSRKDCRRIDGDGDDGCKSCSAAFRCCNSPCCCSVRTAKRSRVDTMGSQMECWDDDGGGNHSWVGIRELWVWRNLALCCGNRRRWSNCGATAFY